MSIYKLGTIAAYMFTLMNMISLACPPAYADAVSDFYRGKTVRVVIGYGVGGGYDINARLAAQYMSKYLPGNPTFVPQNMPGASGLTEAGYLYLSAPKDGTVIGTIPVNLARDQALKGENAKYDAKNYFWIGRMVSGAGTHFAWHKSGIKSFADLKTREVVAAGTGPQANSVVYPLITNQILGTRIKVITGFKGTADAILAMERGEVDLVLEPWQTIKSGHPDLIRDKQLELLVQYTTKRHPDLPDVPTILELCENDEQRSIFNLLLSSSEIGRSLVMPPDVPRERAQAMRAAFRGMMEDENMLKKAEVQHLELDMLPGEELEQYVLSSFKTPPALVAKLRTMLGEN